MARRRKVDLLPSVETCQSAVQLWERIKARFELSELWRLAPPELVAVEFLSILRFALAPLRVEGALYDLSRSSSFFAATLPRKIDFVGWDLGASRPAGLEFATDSFFADGGTAADRWINGLPKGTWRDVVGHYAEYLRIFRAPTQIPLTETIILKLLVDEQYDDKRIKALVTKLDIGRLLANRSGQPAVFQARFRPLRQGLTDFMMQDFLERLENDLAVLLDAEAPDIWLLLSDQASPGSDFDDRQNSADDLRHPRPRRETLKFHISTWKLARLQEYYSENQEVRSVKAGTVGALRQKVEIDQKPGAFRGNLTDCWKQVHTNKWTDSSSLTVDHLACIAEKFEGWPVDRGIAGDVVVTGCSEIVRNFQKDYRVSAYNVSTPLAQFYRTRLAERVFITTNPNLVEIPLLWGIDELGQGRCGAMLLVLFDESEDAVDEPGYFAQRALSIRATVEPWFLLFEHHGRLMEWSKVIHHHIIHETKVGVEIAKTELGLPSMPSLEAQLRLLWSAYSFTQDNRGLVRSRIPVSEFFQSLSGAIETVVTAASPYRYRLAHQFSIDLSQVGEVDVVLELFRYLSDRFLRDCAATLSNLDATDGLNDAEREILVNVRPDFSEMPGQRRIIVEIEHKGTVGLLSFARQHGDRLGKIPVVSDDGKDVHLGLYYLGVLMRACGGDFLQPRELKDGGFDRLRWSLSFPFFPANLGTAASRRSGDDSNVGRRR
jgi:hypothetical protein